MEKMSIKLKYNFQMKTIKGKKWIETDKKYEKNNDKIIREITDI